MASEPDVVGYRALARFRHLIRRFLVFSEQEARAAGLQPQQHQLLLAVKGLPPGVAPTVGVLAWQLQLRHHTLVGLIDRTAALGMVRRVRHERDRRIVQIELTPRGEAVLRKLSLAHRQEIRRAVPQLLPSLVELFDDPISESGSLKKEAATCPTPLRSPDPKKERLQRILRVSAISPPRLASSRWAP